MVKLKIIACFLFLFVFQSHIHAAIHPTQKLTFNSQPLLAYNKYSNLFYAFEDSSFYWEYSLRNNSWIKKALFSNIDIPFHQLKNEFAPMGVNKNELLFVHKSCGSVYSFRNGRIKRIDNSFIHKNQYGAAIYETNGTVYFFGGYGFFETKNTHDFYLRSANEWFAVSKSTNQKPSPRATINYVISENNVYFFGGQFSSNNGNVLLSDCWKCKLTTNEWEMIGYMNEKLSRQINNARFLTNVSAEFILLSDHLIHLSPESNHYAIYSNPYFHAIQYIINDKESKQLLVLEKSSDGNKYKLFVVPTERILTNKIEQGKIVENTFQFVQLNFKNLFYGSIIIIVVLLLLLVYKPNLIANRLNRNSLLLRESFNEKEWQVLLHIFQHPNLELSDLNQYFDEEQLNFETLKKRRESFLKHLRKKIAYLTPINYSDVFIELKHESDKRIKCISLNKNIKIAEYQDDKIG